MNKSEIFLGVSETIAKVLELSVDDVKLESRLVEDLGADSLDLLDLVFQLEKRFHVKINPRDIERSAKAKLGTVPMEVDGVYTAEALLQLRASLPDVPACELSDGLEVKHLPRVFRTSTFVNLVGKILEER